MSTTVPPFVYAGEYRGEQGLQGLPGPGSAAWAALQVVAVGSVRQAPDGSWIRSTTARTTRATFDTTEAGFWRSTIATSATDQAALSAAITGAALPGQTHYVTVSGNDSNDGTSWAAAFATLDAAFAVAAANDTIELGNGHLGDLTTIHAVPANGITIRGQGRSKTWFTVPSGLTLGGTAALRNLIDIDSLTDVTLRDFSILGPGEGLAGLDHTDVTAISFRGAAHRPTVMNVFVTGCRQNFKFRGDEGGAAGTTATLLNDVSVTACRSEKSGNYGFNWEWVDRYAVSDCHGDYNFLDSFKPSKRTYNGQFANISGCHSANGDGMDTFAGGDTLSIANATFDYNRINGLTVKSSTLNGTDPTNNGLVRHNSFTNVKARHNGAAGITVHRFNGWTGDDPTYPLSANITIVAPQCHYNGQMGMFLMCRDTTVVAPQCNNNGHEGIWVSPVSFGIEIISPVVSGNSDPNQPDNGGAFSTAGTYDGIKIEGTRVRVRGGRSVGTNPDGAKTYADIAAGTKTQRYGVYCSATASDVSVEVDTDLNLTDGLFSASTDNISMRSTTIGRVKTYRWTSVTAAEAFVLPSGWKSGKVRVCAGTSGGGSGARGAAGIIRSGGGASAGSAYSDNDSFTPDDIPGVTTLYIDVGAAGAGGAAVTTDNTDGNPGTAGNPSMVRTSNAAASVANVLCYAAPGTPGSGGTRVGSIGAGGVTGAGRFSGGAGTASTATGLVPSGTAGTANGGGAPGGGGGGGITAANVASNGGDGAYPTWFGYSARPTGGVSPGGAGAAGANGPSLGSGQSGAGGAAHAAGAGGAGGAGARGAGGGGGGASVNGSASGAGGAGGPGFVEITLRF